MKKPKMSAPKAIGLIAGNRRFPVVFAQEAKQRGVRVVAVGIKGETDPHVARLADKFIWLSLKEFDKLPGILKAEGITSVVMAGQISPVKLFSREVKESPFIQELLARMKDKKANTIFGTIAERLASVGITLESSTMFLDDYLPQKGVLTATQPIEEEWEDIRFGLGLAKKVADLDIGLAVGVKNKAIVAVEAFEGTDNLIRRAGWLARKGVVIVKVGRTGQDMRFDIPVIGLATVKTLARANASCLAFEAGTTLMLDRQQAIQLADRKKISLVAV